MGKIYVRKNLINNVNVFTIHVKSKNIIKYIIFENIVIKEIIQNYDENSVIIIKLYLSRKRKSYNTILHLLLKKLKKFNNIMIVKI